MLEEYKGKCKNNAGGMTLVRG